MCDRYLHCPWCSKRCVALTSVAGDNATGLYLEFFLVKPTGTESDAFVPTRTHAVRVVGSDASATTATGAETVGHVIGVPSDAYPSERGFDDDEDPKARP